MKLKHDSRLSPGTWKVTKTEGVKMVLAKCPNGHISSMGHHVIMKGGRVTPSLVCPHAGCDFHEFVTLLDWDYVNQRMADGGGSQ